MSYVDGSTWAALHYCSYPAFALLYGQAIPMGGERDKVQWGQSALLGGELFFFVRILD